MRNKGRSTLKRAPRQSPRQHRSALAAIPYLGMYGSTLGGQPAKVQKITAITKAIFELPLICSVSCHHTKGLCLLYAPSSAYSEYSRPPASSTKPPTPVSIIALNVFRGVSAYRPRHSIRAVGRSARGPHGKLLPRTLWVCHGLRR